MISLNKTQITGRLTADPELRNTNGTNIPVASFTLAVNRRTKGEKQTDFIDIVAWRERAEFASRYFKKGMAVYVEGSLQTQTWKDDAGKNRKKTVVVANDMQFAESKQQQTQAQQVEYEELAPDEELPF